MRARDPAEPSPFVTTDDIPAALPALTYLGGRPVGGESRQRDASDGQDPRRSM
ncbi:hypothetical protein [Streptomyces yangpuensis]|uniref:hypothetical protein n=1 Tax=Streptomyces yangpuensis TaxID=1648182 RepID=UPI000AA78737|nr:hypothetical protein [Streptomyces yangpuensis]